MLLKLLVPVAAALLNMVQALNLGTASAGPGELPAYSKIDLDNDVIVIPYQPKDLKEPLLIFHPASNDTPIESVGVFLSGFNGNQPVSEYENVLKYTSYHSNMFVIGLAKMSLIQATNVTAQRLIRVTEAIPSILKDFNKTLSSHQSLPYLMSHSAGSRAAYVAALELFPQQKVSGLILLDPVDGDPFGLIQPIIPEHSQVNISIPLLQISTILGLKKQTFFKKTCTPLGISGTEHWANAFTKSSRWFSNVKIYGHADILNPRFAHLAKNLRICEGVKDEIKDPLENFWRYIGGQIRGFTMVINAKVLMEQKEIDKSQAKKSIMRGRYVLEVDNDKQNPFPTEVTAGHVIVDSNLDTSTGMIFQTSN